MDKLSREEILHVANLARIELTEEEIEKYQIHIKKLLDDIQIFLKLKGERDKSVHICAVQRECV